MTGAAAKIHPTAIVEPDVVIGDGTSVWSNVHVRRGARIGRSCILGENTYVAYGVAIGDLCKLNAGVYVCAGTAIGRGVMIAAHTVFTNDLLPRAADPELTALLPSEPTAATRGTTVADGATIGANCTIGPGLALGAFCMVGMGSVVTRDVPAHALVLGNPARLCGVVCGCGQVLAKGGREALPARDYACACGRRTAWRP